MEDGGTAAREAQRRRESHRARRIDRSLEARLRGIDPGEREHVVGPVQAERLGRVARGDEIEQGARERGVERRPARKARVDEVHAAHARRLAPGGARSRNAARPEPSASSGRAHVASGR